MEGFLAYSVNNRECIISNYKSFSTEEDGKKYLHQLINDLITKENGSKHIEEAWKQLPSEKRTDGYFILEHPFTLKPGQYVIELWVKETKYFPGYIFTNQTIVINRISYFVLIGNPVPQPKSITEVPKQNPFILELKNKMNTGERLLKPVIELDEMPHKNPTKREIMHDELINTVNSKRIISL